MKKTTAIFHHGERAKRSTFFPPPLLFVLFSTFRYARRTNEPLDRDLTCTIITNAILCCDRLCNNCFKFSYRASARFFFLPSPPLPKTLLNSAHASNRLQNAESPIQWWLFPTSFCVKFPSCTFQYVTMRLPIIVSTFSHRHYFTKSIYIYVHVEIDADFCTCSSYIYIYISSLSTVNFLPTYLCIATINNVENWWWNLR